HSSFRSRRSTGDRVDSHTSSTLRTSWVILYPYVPSLSPDTTARTIASRSAAPVLKTISSPLSETELLFCSHLVFYFDVILFCFLYYISYNIRCQHNNYLNNLKIF